MMPNRVIVFISFFLIFIIAFLLCNISFGYISTAIRSIEQQFEVSNSLSEALEYVANFGFVVSVILVAYFGSVNKLRWIGGSVVVVAVGCLMVGLPGVINKGNAPTKFDSMELYRNVTSEQVYQLAMAVTRMRDYYKQYKTLPNPTDRLIELGLIKCTKPSIHNSMYKLNLDYYVEFKEQEMKMFNPKTLARKYEATCILQRAAAGTIESCNPVANQVRRDMMPLRCQHNQLDGVAYTIMFIGVILIGIGHAVPWVLGVSFIGEFANPRNMSLYSGLLIGLRILAPFLGSIVGAKFNENYVTMENAPLKMNDSDPRWIGAWWVGYVSISVILLVIGCLLVILSWSKMWKNGQQQRDPDQTASTEKSLISKGDSKYEKRSGIFGEIKSVLSSFVLITSTVARTFDALAVVGLIGYLASYGEVQFGLKKMFLDKLAVPAGVISVVVGVLIGTIVVRLTCVNRRKAAITIATLSILIVVFGFINLGNQCGSYQHISDRAVSQINNATSTDATLADQCNCRGSALVPVCDYDGKVYYNPCYAGCQSVNPVDVKKFNISFEVCLNVRDQGAAIRDFCDYSCKGSSIVFIVTVSLSFVFTGFLLVPSVLFVLRSVEPGSETVAFGIHLLLVHISCFLLSPAAYRALSNAACISSGDSCDGEGTGDCRQYDSSSMRHYMFSFFAIMKLVAAVFDIAMCFGSKQIDLYRDTRFIKRPAYEVGNEVELT